MVGQLVPERGRVLAGAELQRDGRAVLQRLVDGAVVAQPPSGRAGAQSELAAPPLVQ